MLRKYPHYKQANTLHDTCIKYATSYALLMLHRVQEEQPDYFEEKGADKNEFMAHLINNVCLGEMKYKSAVYKDTIAKVADDGYTTDQIRRLANGGDRFHPYL